MNKYFLILFIFLNLSISVNANPNLNIRTGILMDYHSDKILYEYDPDTQIYPASMTKIMTSIVAFDLLKKKINYHLTICSLSLKMLGDYRKVDTLLCLLW